MFLGDLFDRVSFCRWTWIAREDAREEGKTILSGNTASVKQTASERNFIQSPGLKKGEEGIENEIAKIENRLYQMKADISGGATNEKAYQSD